MMLVNLKLNIREGAGAISMMELMNFLDAMIGNYGNEAYGLVLDMDDDSSFIVHESFKSPKDYADFMNSDFPFRFMAQLGPYFTSVEQIA